MAGFSNLSSLYRSYSTGNISGGDHVGGIVGQFNGIANQITNCYSTGNISGGNYVGGIAGEMHDSSIYMLYCYSTGNISGTDSVGGLAGKLRRGIVANSAALNSSVNAAGETGYVGRVVGEHIIGNYSIIRGNIAFEGMMLNGQSISDDDPDNFNGKDAGLDQVYDAAFWTDTNDWFDVSQLTQASWNSDSWMIEDNMLPVLRDVPGQSGIGRDHLKRDISDAEVQLSGDLTYTGSVVRPEVKVIYGGRELKKGRDYTAAITSTDNGSTVSGGMNVGEVTLTVSGSGNFYGTKDITYTIGKKKVTVTATAGQKKTYGEPDPVLTYTVPAGSGSIALAGALSREAGEDAGTYAITIGTLNIGDQSVRNYELVLDSSAVFTIEKRGIILAADDKTVAKGVALPRLTYTVANLREGDTTADALALEPVLECPAFDSNTPGSYTITISGGTATPNYTITAYTNGTLTVLKTYTDTFDPNGGTRTWTVGTGDSDNTVLATLTLDDEPDGNGNISISITEEMVEEGIRRAGAGQPGNENGGISLAVSNISDGAGSMTVTIGAGAISKMVSMGVKSLTVRCGIYGITLDEEAIKMLAGQFTGDITVTVVPYKVSGIAATVTGTRPVFEITFRDSNGKEITGFGAGTITRRIRYTPALGEDTGNLAIVRVTGGDVEWIAGSGYEDGWMIWSGNSNSVYGVGYKADAYFTDAENHWAKEYIGYAASRGLISGLTAETFAPDTAITRADFIMALGRLSGADVSGYKASSFIDVDDNSAAMPYIEWAYRNGIVAGTGSDRFSPDAAITREQMAVMLWNYAKAAGLAMPVLREYAPFTDEDMVSSWAGEAVRAVVRAGIIIGRDGGRFVPRGSATRAEAAVVLKRFVESVVD